METRRKRMAWGMAWLVLLAVSPCQAKLIATTIRDTRITLQLSGGTAQKPVAAGTSFDVVQSNEDSYEVIDSATGAHGTLPKSDVAIAAKMNVAIVENPPANPAGSNSPAPAPSAPPTPVPTQPPAAPKRAKAPPTFPSLEEATKIYEKNVQELRDAKATYNQSDRSTDASTAWGAAWRRASRTLRTLGIDNLLAILPTHPDDAFDAYGVVVEAIGILAGDQSRDKIMTTLYSCPGLLRVILDKHWEASPDVEAAAIKFLGAQGDIPQALRFRATVILLGSKTDLVQKAGIETLQEFYKRRDISDSEIYSLLMEILENATENNPGARANADLKIFAEGLERKIKSSDDYYFSAYQEVARLRCGQILISLGDAEHLRKQLETVTTRYNDTVKKTQDYDPDYAKKAMAWLRAHVVSKSGDDPLNALIAHVDETTWNPVTGKWEAP